jgi:CheY-like chemotaxis protein
MSEPIRRILVVDDDGDVRGMMREVLERAGYDVIDLPSGAEALALIARLPPPALILLDLGMDDVSGWEVLDALKKARLAAHFPVIVVSGHPAASVPRGARLLRKPIGAQELLAAVRASCEAYGQAAGRASAPRAG